MLASEEDFATAGPADRSRRPRQRPKSRSGRVRRREAVLAELATRRALHDRIDRRGAQLQREREALHRNLLRR